MKLTKQIKEVILNAALKKAGINDREAAIRSRYAQWAEAVRLLYVTEEVVALFESAEAASRAVPSEIRDYSFSAYHRAKIDCNVAGCRREIYWNGSQTYEGRDKGVTRLCPYSATLTTDSPLVEIIYAIDHDNNKLNQEKEQLKLSLLAVLNSVTTDKRLVEVWPEAVAFIPAAEKTSSVNYPALPIAELNKMIGLP